MYVRDKSSHRLPPGILLLLSLCVCVLVLHFIAEDIATAGGTPGMNLPAQSELASSCHEHGEDQFVHPRLTHSPSDFSGLQLVPSIVFCTFSFPLSPQHPPPNC